MAVNSNNGNGKSHGFGGVDWVAPGTVKTDPGAKPATTSNYSDWVRQDMEYKASLPQQKFY